MPRHSLEEIMSWLDQQDPVLVERRLEELRETPPRAAAHANGDERFGLWLHLADVACMRSFGISIFDLADWGWYSAYESGQGPKRAMLEAMEEDDLGAAMLAELRETSGD